MRRYEIHKIYQVKYYCRLLVPWVYCCVPCINRNKIRLSGTKQRPRTCEISGVYCCTADAIPALCTVINVLPLYWYQYVVHAECMLDNLLRGTTACVTVYSVVCIPGTITEWISFRGYLISTRRWLSRLRFYPRFGVCSVWPVMGGFRTQTRACNLLGA